MIRTATAQGLVAPAPGELPSEPVSKPHAELPCFTQGVTHLEPVQTTICLQGEILWLLKRVDVPIFDEQVPQV